MTGSISTLALVALVVIATTIMSDRPSSVGGGTIDISAASSPPRYLPVERVFISGHSLVDQPFPDHLARLSASAQAPIQWNRQYLPGSSIKERTRGASSIGWSGYSRGIDRNGNPIDTLHEIWRPASVDGVYDTLIVTEQHSLLENILWNDTIRYLRDFHERIVGMNPRAQTFFYQSWLTVSDLNAPGRWIAYEKAADPVWACVVERINLSLAAEGRADRIRALPVALALATLVEAATGSAGVPGISAETRAATMARLFRDDVHLTDVGSYYIALASFALIHGKPAQGSWAPPGMAHGTAEALRHHAWRFAASRSRFAPMSLSQCRDYVGDRFVPLYLAYQRDTSWRMGGPVRTYVNWVRYRIEWPHLFRGESAANPFYFSPETDRGYWLHQRRNG